MLTATEPRPVIPPTIKPALDAAMGRPRLAELSARDRWTRQQLLAYQNERLQAALQHAVHASPYYRETIGHLVARDAPLEEFPVLTKSQLVANFDRIATDRRLKLADVEHHLAGEHAAELLHGEYRACATGGTTGVRAVMVYDRPAWDYVVANATRSNGMAGIAREARSVGIGAPTPQHLSYRIYGAMRRANPNVPHLHVMMPMPEVVAALNEFQPDVISTYPSFIRLLAEEQMEGRLKISARRFCSVAEMLMPEVRDLARKAWGAAVFNRYSTTETACSGSECEHHCGIHLPEDLVVFEAVDDANRHVPTGVRGHRLLTTTLTNALVPLIRYEMSDMVTMTDGSCACGRPYARITSIEGRREEVLELPRRGGGRIQIDAFRLLSPLDAMPGVRQYQLLTGANKVTVKISMRNGESRQKIRNAIEQKIRNVLADAGAGDTELAVEIADSIERSGTGAKLRLVAKAAPKDTRHDQV
ncbi:phenylacetate--CoA ligase family protein [Taklimakanibacter deserti]|uniref:phenylacetate--CoA ligase family protein n=1 Tax=Taklimakanibacter deserti TaxID=2267839 RepID=UPI000E64CB16